MNSTISNLDNQSTFTYDEGIEYFESLNVTCTSNKDCPNHTTCGIYSDPREECTDLNDCTKNCVGHFYCKKDKSVCSFNRAEGDGIKYNSFISQSVNRFGLKKYEECRYDGECFREFHCLNKNVFGIGRCEEPSDSSGLSVAVGYASFIVIMIFIIASIGFCICISSCIRYSENRKRVKKGLAKKKNTALKPLIIIGSIALTILLSFITLVKIDKHLNEQSYS